MIKQLIKRYYARRFRVVLDKERKFAIKMAKETKVEWLVVLNTRLRPQAFSKGTLKKMTKKMNKSFTKVRRHALYITPKTFYTK